MYTKIAGTEIERKVGDRRMKYRRLGKSGLKVSEISLGSWLTYGGYVEKQNAVQAIETAYDLGINFFDTANVYERGAAEMLLGETLKAYQRRIVRAGDEGVLADGRRTERPRPVPQARASSRPTRA